MKKLLLFYVFMAFLSIQSYSQDIRPNLMKPEGDDYSGLQLPASEASLVTSNPLRLPKQIFPGNLNYKRSLFKSQSGTYKPVTVISDTTHKTIYSYKGNENTIIDQELKNGIWENVSRTITNYDNNGNLLMMSIEQWQNGSWIYNNKYTYNYDEHSNILTWNSEEWQNGSVKNKYRGAYTYDDYGNELTSLSEQLLYGIWVGVSRETHTYDSNSKTHTVVLESYMNGVWFITNSYRFYSFRSDDRDTVISSAESWYDGAWKNYFKFTTTYSGNSVTGDSVVNSLYETGDGNSWKNESRTTSTFKKRGKPLTTVRESWRLGTNDYIWMKDSRKTYTYDNDGRLLVTLMEAGRNNNWENSARETNTYDSNGNLTLFLSEQYFYETWVNNIKEIFTYDENGNGIKGERFKWTAGVIWLPDSSYFPLKYNNGKDILDCSASVVEVEYSLITDVENASQTVSKFSLSQNYPNPFNPSTTISYSIPKAMVVNLKVYNILGKEIYTLVNEYQSVGSHSVEFDASDFPSGMYIYEIKAGNFIKSGKMLLLK